MTLDQFIISYDFTGSIILLEGKRIVPETAQPKLKALGQLLAERMVHATFRSGNANGADLYFSQGIAAVSAERLQVVIPFGGHRSKSNLAGSTLNLEEVDLSEYPDIVALSALNKKTTGLLQRYINGERNRITNKVAFIIRDTLKVAGVEGFPAISFGIFYDDPIAPRSGGTGHTIEVCAHCNIPFVDQSVWLKWLD